MDKSELINKIELLDTKLKNLEERFEALSNASFDAIFFSEKGKCIGQNAVAEKMFGYKNSEAIGKMGTDWIIPEDREIVMNKMISGDENPYGVQALRKDGSSFPAEIRGKMVAYMGRQVRVTVLRDISAHKNIEETLQETTAKYRTLLNEIPAGIYITDTLGHCQYVNSAWSKMSGISLEDAKGEGWKSAVYEEDRELVFSRWTQLIDSKVDWGLEYRLFDGKDIHWVYGKVRELHNLKGEFIGYLGINSEITALKNAIEETQEKSAFIDRMIEGSALSTWISDHKGMTIRANQACLDFYGAKSEEVIGKYNLFQDEVIKAKGFMPEIEKVFNEGKVANLVIDYNFGAVQHVDVKDATHKIINSIITPIQDSSGKVSNAIIQTIDLTQVKNAENQAIKERNKAQRYLNIAGVMMLGIDSEGIVVLINPKGCEILGYSESEVLGKNWIQNFVPKELAAEIEEVSAKVYSGELKVVADYENEVITKSGEKRLIAWHNSVLKNENGQVTGTLSSGEDITDRRQNENALKEALRKAEESDKLKSAFLANVSHEIRTPLNSILGFSDLLDEFDLDDIKKEEYIKIIKSGGNQLLAIIDDIVNISVIEAGQMAINKTVFHVGGMVDEICQFFSATISDRVNISADCEPDICVYSDPDKIKQVITNLLTNAIKNTNNGVINIKCEKDQNYVRFCVSDSGRGIPAGLEDRLFERFYRVEDTSRTMHGTGLGLAICLAIVKALGGEIWYESVINEGASFYFTIPISSS